MNKQPFTIFAVTAIFLLLLLSLVANPRPGKADGNEVTLYFFWGEGCPFCEEQKPYLADFSERYPNLKIKKFEVYHNRQNREFFDTMLDEHGIEFNGVPQTFIGAGHWTGFRPPMAHEMETTIRFCQRVGCPDPAAGVEPNRSPPDRNQARRPEPIDIPLLGTVEIADQPLWLSTILIAFVDGFNPCSIWVLTLLLALVIQTRSRSRIILVGVTFLIITASTYGAFIAGLYTVFDFIDRLFLIQLIVAILALLFGLVNIKDFFAFKKGFSFSIPERFQPKIYRGLRELANPKKSLPALLITTAIMALGITLVELPCTAGFPVVWNTLILLQDIHFGGFFSLLLLYVTVYLLIELIIFLSAVFTLDATQLQQKHGEVLKLFGGIIMVALAAVIFYDPTLMNNINFTLQLFGVTTAVTIIIVIIRKFYFQRQS